MSKKKQAPRVDSVPEGEHGDLPRSATTVMRTPGPWRYFSGTHSVASEAERRLSNAVCIVCGPTSWRGESQRDKEREGNARLIIAAPDLLEVLKVLVDLLNDDLDESQAAAWDAAR